MPCPDVGRKGCAKERRENCCVSGEFRVSRFIFETLLLQQLATHGKHGSLLAVSDTSFSEDVMLAECSIAFFGNGKSDKRAICLAHSCGDVKEV